MHKVTKKPEAAVPPWGVPGEEHKLIVAPLFKDDPRDPKKLNVAGQWGRYRVQFLLARPGYPTTKEREHKFIDDVVGSSHIKIAKPKAERGRDDTDRIVLQLLGKNYQIFGEPNDDDTRVYRDLSP
jgi:hypothetical protein